MPSPSSSTTEDEEEEEESGNVDMTGGSGVPREWYRHHGHTMNEETVVEPVACKSTLDKRKADVLDEDDTVTRVVEGR
jgi:hypothetical protein